LAVVAVSLLSFTPRGAPRSTHCIGG
jgi:hypothetical protein